MDRAEKLAMEQYPVPKDNIFANSVRNAQRAAFQLGYLTAEEDLALTVKDLELLHTFLYAVKNNKQGCFTFTRLSDEQYQKVLRRFNDQREKK